MDEKTKLEILRKTVLEEANRRASEIEQETEQVIRKKYAQNQKELEKEVKNKTELTEQRLKLKLEKEFSQQSGNYRKEIFRTRERYIDDIFEKVIEELENIKNTDTYIHYLKASYHKAVLELGGYDKVYAKPSEVVSVKEYLGISSVYEDMSIKYGGIVIEYNNLVADCTFDFKLKNEREQFSINGIFSLDN